MRMKPKDKHFYAKKTNKAWEFIMFKVALVKKPGIIYHFFDFSWSGIVIYQSTRGSSGFCDLVIYVPGKRSNDPPK